MSEVTLMYVCIMKEYDELSKLCDKLLDQQNRLESELKEQSAYIKVRLSM